MYVARVPALSLIDVLRDVQGDELVHRKVVQTCDSDKVVDVRDRWCNKSYFRCVLALQDLLNANLTEIPRRKPQAYYDLILKTKTTPPAGLKAKAYAALRDGSTALGGQLALPPYVDPRDRGVTDNSTLEALLDREPLSALGNAAFTFCWGRLQQR